MIETIIGIIVGCIFSWVVAHYYYKRQTKEQINPLPHIKGVHDVVLELYGMAIEQKDEEVQRRLKELVVSMIQVRIRLMNRLTPTAFLIAEIEKAHKTEDYEQLKDYLNETADILQRIKETFSELGKEYDVMLDVAAKILGKPLGKLFNEQEIDAIFRIDDNKHLSD